MPWTIDDVDEHKAGLNADQKRQWVAVANSVLEECMADGGTDEECAAKAIRQANGVVGAPQVDNDRTYNSWRNMIQRCYNRDAPNYSNYGGRGITVISRWRESYENFLEDMGPRPAGKTLGRKNKDGNYSKLNCEWQDYKEQNSRENHSYSVDMSMYKGDSGLSVSDIRHEVFQNRRHLVIPVIMMVEGVHNGSHGPVLHLAEDLAKFPGAWDGIPVSIGHPDDNGVHVSANSPDVIDRQVVGRVFNTHMDGVKLKAEAWIDEQQIQQLSPEALGYIAKGLPLDVSVGVFTEEDDAPGDWRGEAYSAIARNHRPDHLALLPGGTGACSWQDGCGVRVNEAQEKEVLVKTYSISYKDSESAPWSKPNLANFNVEGRWQDLSPEERSRVASHFLIGDDSAANFGELTFPVVNPKTGKLNEAALRAVIGGRGAQANISAAQRISARRQAYKLLNDEFDAGLEMPKTLEESMKEFSGLGLSINEMSHSEIAGMIQNKLDMMDDDEKLHFLSDCYGDYFVYSIRPRLDTPSPMLPSTENSNMFRRGYKVSNNKVEFIGEAQPVVKKTEYVTMEKGGTDMSDKNEKTPCCPEKVELLIQNELTGFDEGDREWLLGLDEAQLAKLEPKEAQPGAGDSDPQMNRERAIQALREELGDRTKFMAILPPETREIIEHGQRLYDAERDSMINNIMTNSAGAITREWLEGKPMDDLRMLSNGYPARPSFAPLGPVQNPQTNVEDKLLPIGVDG